MELGLKAWILIGGALVILAVLAHGLWLSRQRARHALRMDIERGVERGVDDASLFSAELPGGGKARVVSAPRGSAAGELQPDRQAPTCVPDSEPVPAQQTLPNLDDPVPVLLEAVDSQDEGAGGEAPIRAEKRAGRALTAESAVVRSPRSSSAAVARPPSVVDIEEPQEPLEDPDEILTFAVVARDPEGFPGDAVVRFVTERGLSYGDMNIFHYRIGARAQYSMANLVEPGTFDLATIEDMRLRGVTFFMRLPGPERPLEALDHMFGVLQGLADTFDGDLLDGERSVLTRQGIEHARDLVRSYTRRRMTRRA